MKLTPEQCAAIGTRAFIKVLENLEAHVDLEDAADDLDLTLGEDAEAFIEALDTTKMLRDTLLEAFDQLEPPDVFEPTPPDGGLTLKDLGL